jgi:acyl transferase domain-containing protein/SAM-dependent methyltransferase
MPKGKPNIYSDLKSGDKTHLKPVAVCGVALRLPGGINSTEGLWNALRNGEDMRCEVPESRYCRKGFSDALGSKGAIQTQYGYFLDQDLASFDSSLFSLSEEEANKTDPQQRILLEVVKECFENAGEIDYRGKNIGCYVGTFGEDWLQSQSKEDQHSGGYLMSGQIDLMLANRVSYENDLRGPSMVIKTGCSASLIALHEACRALQMNDCSGAIVAGTNLILGPTMTAGMTSEGILSPEGSCKTFDSKADGFARGEAITAIYLQLLDTALQERLPIRSIITNTGVNSDGRSQSLLQPSAEAQIALMCKVHGDIGSDPARTAFVECHGTGTPTGDPIEVAAVGKVFGNEGVYIGSVKPNLGHSEGASGISSLLKSIVMLEKGMIVPNIKFLSPNPKIEFERYRLQVPLKLTPWPRDRDLRVAINSFGIGGSNVHIIVEHPYTHFAALNGLVNIRFGSPQLLLMSASTPLSLQTLSERYKGYIEAHPDSLPNLAYTLARRREHRPYRTFAVCTEEAQYKPASISRASAKILEVTMVFSGQGAQWAQMGHELLHDNAEFLQIIKAMDRVLQSLRYPPNWSIESELKKPPGPSQVNRAEISQPLCTALQIAIFQVLTVGGVRPSTVVGHSSGEIAAAHAAGALSIEEAIIVAYYRGFITRHQTLNGGMASIGLDSKTTSNFLKPGVVIACENSPNSTTISGDGDVLLSVIEEIKDHHDGVLARPLKVDMAYHSHHMKKLSTRYLELVQDELESRHSCQENKLVPMFSSVWDRKVVSAKALSPEYWVANLVSPVRFHTAIANALREKGDNLLLEIGPHSALAGPLRQICSAMGVTFNYCPTLIRHSHSTHSMLTALGTLYQHGFNINWDALVAEGEVLTDLPVYPWNHSASHWYESRLAKAWRLRRFGHHELLGLRVPQTTNSDPVWRVMLHVEDVSWLTDHKIRGDIVFPFAAYVSMAGEAFRQISSMEEGYFIRNATVATAMVLDEERHLEVVTTLHAHYLDHADIAENLFDFTIASYTGSTWIQHCKGIIGPPRALDPVATTMDTLSRKVIPKTWYREMARLGLVYGPTFRRIEFLSTSTKQMLAVAQVSRPFELQSSHYALHPATIDASFQVGLAALTKGLCRNFLEPLVPTSIQQLEVLHGSAKIDYTASCSTANGELSIDGMRSDGKLCLRLRGMKLIPLADDNLVAGEDIYGAARLEWVADYDFQEVNSLVKIPAAGKHEKQIIEELALLCIVESARLLHNLTPSMRHLLKYRTWLDWVAEEALAGKHPVLRNTAVLVSLPAEERQCRIEKLCKEASSSPFVSSFAEAIMRIRNNIQGLFTGEIDTLELLLRENNLAQIYDAVSFDYSDFISTLSDTVPNLRVLEIGAGTGGTTELILRGMQRLGRFPRYAKYTFSDISAGFFPKARERFEGAPNMDFKVFDVSQDPFKQGFEPESYHLILAANVVHATPTLIQTLQNLQLLLVPRGQLVLTEFCTSFRAPNYIYGNFSGWWLGEADDRKWEPYVNIARWDKELKTAGFSGASDVVLDSEEPWQYCATIVAQKLPAAKDTNLTRNISVLCEIPEADFNQSLMKGLKKEGFNPCFVDLRHLSGAEGDLIASIDLEANFFENISKENFVLFQNLCRSLEGRNLLWLMHPTQVNCVNPRGSQSLGMIRTARSELDLSITTLEIESLLPDLAKFVLDVFQKVRSQKDHGSLAPDREFAVHNNIVKVGRYRPFELQHDFMHNSVSPEAHKNSLRITQVLKTPCPEESLPLPIPAGSVEIDVRATGISLRVGNTTVFVRCMLILCRTLVCLNK